VVGRVIGTRKRRAQLVSLRGAQNLKLRHCLVTSITDRKRSAGTFVLLTHGLSQLTDAAAGMELCILNGAAIDPSPLSKFLNYIGLRTLPYVGRQKMREWKIRYGQICKGGKFRSRLVWKAVAPILYSDTALSYFLKIFFRLLSE